MPNKMILIASNSSFNKKCKLHLNNPLNNNKRSTNSHLTLSLNLNYNNKILKFSRKYHKYLTSYLFQSKFRLQTQVYGSNKIPVTKWET